MLFLCCLVFTGLFFLIIKPWPKVLNLIGKLCDQLFEVRDAAKDRFGALEAPYGFSVSLQAHKYRALEVQVATQMHRLKGFVFLYLFMDVYRTLQVSQD